jgi:hypothetical protein
VPRPGLPVEIGSQLFQPAHQLLEVHAAEYGRGPRAQADRRGPGEGPAS